MYRAALLAMVDCLLAAGAAVCVVAVVVDTGLGGTVVGSAGGAGKTVWVVVLWVTADERV